MSRYIFILLLSLTAISCKAQWIGIWKYSDTGYYDRYDSVQLKGIYKADSNFNIHSIPQITSDGFFLVGFNSDSAGLAALHVNCSRS